MDAVHHQIVKLAVDITGKEATVFCYGTAYHYLPDPTDQNTRTFVGSNNFKLPKSGSSWHITSVKHNLKFITGNLSPEGS